MSQQRPMSIQIAERHGSGSRFVGLRNDTGTGLTLCLPMGFPPDIKSPNEREPFALRQLIRNVLQRFCEDELDAQERLRSQERKSDHRRLAQDRNGGQGLATSEVLKPSAPKKGQEEASPRPSHQALLDSFLRDRAFERLVAAMQRPEVRVLRPRHGWIDGFDTRHLHRAWPRALFVNNVPVFEATPGPKRRLEDDPHQPVLGLAAWLVRDAVQNLLVAGGDLQKALGSGRAQVDQQAQAFAAIQGLQPSVSLFTSAPAVTSQVHRRLSAALEDARKRQAALLPAVRELLHLCEAALHFHREDSSSGVVGIEGFWPVWEALCADWALNHPEHALLEGEAVFCWDTKQPTRLKADQIVKEKTSNDWLSQAFDHNNKARRPDLVTSKCGTKIIARVVDYKYYGPEADWLSNQRWELNGSNTTSEGESERPKEVFDSLEAYRLLAVIHNLRYGLVASHSDKVPEIIPIELWLPGQPHAQQVDAAVLPNLTVRYLCPERLMKSYVEGWRARM